MIYLTNLNSVIDGINIKNYIEDCLFENNQNAIYMNNYGNTSIIRSNFSNNLGSFGGAIYLVTSQLNAFFEIENCAFIENISTDYGGSIYMKQYGNTSIIRSNFSNNFASYGGAIILYFLRLNAFFEIADCAFIENNSTNSGGAIYMDTYGNTSIIRSNFSNNFASSYGGAIYLLNTGSGAFLQIADCAFNENNSTESGGAIYLEKYGNISIISCDFSNNFASFYSAALYFLNQSNFFFPIFNPDLRNNFSRLTVSKV